MRATVEVLRALGAPTGRAARNAVHSTSVRLPGSTGHDAMTPPGPNAGNRSGATPEPLPRRSSGGQFRVNDPGSYDHGEVLVQRGGLILPQHGLDMSRGQAALYSTVPAWHTELVALSSGMYGVCNGGDGMSGAGEHLPADFTFPPGTPLPVTIAVWWALQQLGTAYTFGGSCTDPHSGDPAKQCDCSSLVQQAYRMAGVTLPRVTDDQQHAGTEVADVADLLPGDLIFIPGSGGTMADPGHVGLYIGAGLLIQAPHTGDVVKLTKLSAWTKIAKIRRVVLLADL